MSSMAKWKRRIEIRVPLKSLEDSLHKLFTVSSSRGKLRFILHYAKEKRRDE